MTARAHARRTDPGTSHAAADSVRELTDRQRAVLAILWDAIPAPRATVYEDMTGEVSPSRPPGPERDAMVAQLAAEQDRLFDTPTVRPGHLDLP